MSDDIFLTYASRVFLKTLDLHRKQTRLGCIFKNTVAVTPWPWQLKVLPGNGCARSGAMGRNAFRMFWIFTFSNRKQAWQPAPRHSACPEFSLFQTGRFGDRSSLTPQTAWNSRAARRVAHTSRITQTALRTLHHAKPHQCKQPPCLSSVLHFIRQISIHHAFRRQTADHRHIMKKFLIALLTTALLAIFTGCTTRTSKDTSIPWSRPASWEGGIPGMGNPGEQR
jgi:hypothetical protein